MAGGRRRDMKRHTQGGKLVTNGQSTCRRVKAASQRQAKLCCQLALASNSLLPVVAVKHPGENIPIPVSPCCDVVMCTSSQKKLAKSKESRFLRKSSAAVRLQWLDVNTKATLDVRAPCVRARAHLAASASDEMPSERAPAKGVHAAAIETVK